jgi:hypothetical protein
MKNVKVKIFETTTRRQLEDALNSFMNGIVEDLDLIDIKLHVDPQLDPEWGVTANYLAMVIYR